MEEIGWMDEPGRRLPFFAHQEPKICANISCVKKKFSESTVFNAALISLDEYVAFIYLFFNLA